MADRTKQMCVISENGDVKARTEHEQIFTGRSIGRVAHTTHERSSCGSVHIKATKNRKTLENWQIEFRFESSDVYIVRIVYDFVRAFLGT